MDETGACPMCRRSGRAPLWAQVVGWLVIGLVLAAMVLGLVWLGRMAL